MLQRIVSFILGIALLIAAFFFASVIFAIAAILALIIWGWLMWLSNFTLTTTSELLPI